jgi:hypothetical protein
MRMRHCANKPIKASDMFLHIFFVAWLFVLVLVCVVAGQAHGETVSVRPSDNTALCLDITSGAIVSGTAVQLYPCNDTPSQQWQFYADDTLRVASNPSLCLNAKNGVPSSGSTPTPVQLYTCQGNAWSRQLWSLGDLTAPSSAGISSGTTVNNCALSNSIGSTGATLFAPLPLTSGGAVQSLVASAASVQMWKVVPVQAQAPLVLSNPAGSSFSYLSTDHRIGSFVRSTAVPTIGGQPHFVQVNGGNHVYFCSCCTSWASSVPQGPLWILLDELNFQQEYTRFTQSPSICFKQAWAVKSASSTTWNCPSGSQWPTCGVQDNIAAALASAPAPTSATGVNIVPAAYSTFCLT